MKGKWLCLADFYDDKRGQQASDFDKLRKKLYNNRNRCGADAGNTWEKSKKNSTFFKAVKERKLGQLANEPLEKIRFGAR